MSGAGSEIRTACAHDRSSLEQLERACFPDPWSPRSLAQMLDSAVDLVLVAAGEGDAAVHAYAAFRRAGDEAELLRIAVLPDRQRSGLARSLLREGLDRLARCGVTSCFLEVRSANLAARNLYESEGFRAVGVRPRYYADGADALIYRYRADALNSGRGDGSLSKTWPAV